MLESLSKIAGFAPLDTNCLGSAATMNKSKMGSESAVEQARSDKCVVHPSCGATSSNAIWRSGLRRLIHAIKAYAGRLGV